MQQSGILQGMTGMLNMAGFMNEVKSTLKGVKDLNKWLGNTNSISKYGKDILSNNLKKRLMNTERLIFVKKTQIYL